MRERLVYWRPRAIRREGDDREIGRWTAEGQGGPKAQQGRTIWWRAHCGGDA
jgi:hypothetical protein